MEGGCQMGKRVTIKKVIITIITGLVGAAVFLGAYYAIANGISDTFRSYWYYHLFAGFAGLVGFISFLLIQRIEKVKQIVEAVSIIRLPWKIIKKKSLYERPGLLTWAGYESAFRSDQYEKEFSVNLVEYILGLGKLDARSIYANGRKIFISIIDDELLKEPKGPYSRNLLIFLLTNSLENSGEIFWQNRLGRSLTSEFELPKVNLIKKELIHFAWKESARLGIYLYGLPVRWGVNSIVFKKQLKHDLGEDNLFEEASNLWKKRDCLKIGIFDWELLNLSLFSKYVYWGTNQEDDPFLEKASATERKICLQRLEYRIKRLCNNKNFGIVCRLKTPEDAIKAFSRSDINVLIGGGFWSTSDDQLEEITWTIPKEGGIIWMESVVIFEDARENIKQLIKAIELTQRLFKQDVQIGLSNPNQLFCRGYPTKINALKKLCSYQSTYSEDVKKVFEIDDLDKLTHMTALNPILIKRRYPRKEIEKIWDKIWEKVVLDKVDLYQ